MAVLTWPKHPDGFDQGFLSILFLCSSESAAQVTYFCPNQTGSKKLVTEPRLYLLFMSEPDGAF